MKGETFPYFVAKLIFRPASVGMVVVPTPVAAEASAISPTTTEGRCIAAAPASPPAPLRQLRGGTVSSVKNPFMELRQKVSNVKQPEETNRM